MKSDFHSLELGWTYLNLKFVEPSVLVVSVVEPLDSILKTEVRKDLYCNDDTFNSSIVNEYLRSGFQHFNFWTCHFLFLPKSTK